MVSLSGLAFLLMWINPHEPLVPIRVNMTESVAFPCAFRVPYTVMNPKSVFARVGGSSIPVGVLGLVFEDYFQSIFGNPQYSAIFLALNGLLLIGAEKLSRSDIAHEYHDSDAEIDHRVNAKTAVAIGFGQSLALFAGISRFGVTMSAGLLRKLSHSVASDFAFLLSLPVIVGASIIKLPEVFTTDAKDLLGQIFVGSVVSFIATYFSVTFLVRWFKTKTLYPFAFYCLIVGVISFIRFA